MELIKEIKSKREKNGKLIKWGEFLCIKCDTIVERRLSNGLKAKSCGCTWHNFTDEHKNNISISLKGKKKTEEHKQKISITRIENGIGVGVKNPNWGKKLSEERKLKISEKNKNNSYRKGKKHTPEAKQKISKTRIEKGVAKGENNPMYGVHLFGEKNSQWQNGISFEPYAPEFNKELKQFIKDRDFHICQDPNCEHKSVILCIHHIDYDKQNNNPENLVTLCRKCHIKTFGKFNRIFWTEFYQNIMKNRGF